MKLVRILRDYIYPDLLRQTPGGKGYWNDLRFVLDENGSSDYAIILNGVSQRTRLFCPRQNVWAIMQEPPTEYKKKMHKGFRVYNRIFTQDTSLSGDRYVLSQPALPWHIDKSYDELVSCGIPDKSSNLSWVTSSLKNLKGHRSRMKFLNNIRNNVEFDLFGRGFNFIKNKWDGIAPYKYSLAIENFQNDYYWSEKIADCFLSWTMPIYFGCKKIGSYFPSEAFVYLDDLEDSNITDRIKQVSTSDLWKKNLDAIEYSRNLILNQYQLFPFISNAISEWELGSPDVRYRLENLIIPKLTTNSLTINVRIKRYIKNRFPSLVRFIKRVLY